MSRATHVRMLLAIALAAFVGGPSLAAAGPHGGGHHGGGHHGGSHYGGGGHRPSHGSVSPGRASRGYAPRAPVRDHRPTSLGGHRPYGHHGYTYGPYSYGRGYWPYYGYYGTYDGYYQPYGYQPYAGASPGIAAPVAPPPPRPRAHLGLAAHLGQFERDDGVTAGMAGVSLRWRGRVLEGEIELGRRVYAGGDLVERSVGATLYANLGDPDGFHPYVLAGAGLLDTERVFGTLGAGLALPVAPRLTLAGDVRAASIGDRNGHDDAKLRHDMARSLEGRLSVVVDF